jgi:hypothetical protein
MAQQNDPRPPRGEGIQGGGAQGGGTQVPDLIERYRVRRDAWIAQADELARLRDEVRGAAEREAMEIVTAARRDVRQVIMEARRELLVLSAQVQAALGEVAGKPDPAALLRAHASSQTAAAAGLPPTSATDHSADILVPEAAVKTMLDEARADMEALAHDAKTVPFQPTTIAFPSEPPVPPRAPLPFEPPAPAAVESHQPKVLFETVQPAVLEVPATSLIESSDIRLRPHHESEERSLGSSVQFESIASLSSGSPTASRVFLSSPFPSDSVPVPPGRSVRAFVALFVAAGVIVLGGSVWWMRGHTTSAASREQPGKPAESLSPVAGAGASSSLPAPTPTSAPVLPAKATASPLSLLVAARRQSWIRTTVDGESDTGRTYAAGETVQLNARREIVLRVGDAGAVYVSVNKGDATPLGQAGQVMTKQFVAEALPPSGGGALAPSAPLSTAPKPTPPPASVPTASNTPSAPLPVPVVQPAPSQNAAAIDPTPVAAIGRRDAAPAAFPRAESATVPQPTVPPVAPPVAPPATVPPASNASPASAVVAAARQWLDAYHRQERSTMAALSTENLQLADERRSEERFPAGVEVNRSLDRVSVQIAADTAVLTAVMTERGDAGAQRVSPISQVWILSGGQWRVKQVRLVSEARLNQIFR